MSIIQSILFQSGHFRNTYFMTYGKSLEDAISADTSGDFRRLLIIILQAKREETGFANTFNVGNHAAQILKSFDKKSGIEKFDAFKIFATSNGAHIQKVIEEVERQSGKDFQKIADKELSGDFKNLILSLIETSSNKPRFLANSIHLATKVCPMLEYETESICSGNRNSRQGSH